MSRRPNSPEGKCRDCGRLVYWAEMPNGKMRPFDREPSPNGKAILFKRPDGTLRAEDARPGQQRGAGARTCHFDTCTNRQQRRGPRGSSPAPRHQQGGAPGGFGKVVRVQTIVEYEDGTVLRFQPQGISEVVRAGGAQRRAS
jgi:hypothetical protein